MGKLIQLVPQTKIERAGKNDKELAPKSVQEYITTTKNINEKVENILVLDSIVKINEEELKIIIRNSIRGKLVENRAFTPELFLCGEYVGIIIHKTLMGYFELNQFTQDFFNENGNDFKGAGDINLIKYIYRYDLKRKELSKPQDYMDRATNLYYNAYNNGQLELGYTLAYNLEELDKQVNLQNFVKDYFGKYIIN